MNISELMKKSRTLRHRLVLLVVIIFSWTATPRAQEMAVPVKLQLAFFLKILPFDRNLKWRVGDEIVIAILYQKTSRASVEVKEEFLKVLMETPVKKMEDIPLRFTTIDLEETDLGEAVSKKNVDILYVTPLQGVTTDTIIAVSRAKKITTLTGVPDYVKSGLAVGIGTKGEKPLIIINLKAAKSEGSDFSANLLKLCKVI